MGTIGKYTLLQIPGLILFGIIVYLLYQWDWISDRLAMLLLLLWVIKDVLLYPLYRPALEGGHDPGAVGMVGLTGVVRTDLDPVGLVEVAGERWRARSVDGQTITAGERIEVKDAERLILLVAAIRGEE
ncbi:NfeD family protein [Gammaproteobacteria bacterium AB-CW1]|uniref:NfeD family protein n=1 Tax=Natronospira elongata TaxID=3110268 RepID=A0AAP6MNH3_9GAMM|nr:NfeD family protein [Gammaproteobacteria bacterium AB-CW1]